MVIWFCSRAGPAYLCSSYTWYRRKLLYITNKKKSKYSNRKDRHPIELYSYICLELTSHTTTTAYIHTYTRPYTMRRLLTTSTSPTFLRWCFLVACCCCYSLFINKSNPPRRLVESWQFVPHIPHSFCHTCNSHSRMFVPRDLDSNHCHYFETIDQVPNPRPKSDRGKEFEPNRWACGPRLICVRHLCII